MELEIISRPKAQVGEGPHWDHETGELLWVDLLKGDFYRHDLSSGGETKFNVSQALAAAVPRSGGGFAGAVRDGIATFTDPDDFEIVAPVQLEQTDVRMNDAKCDSRGRFWAGTTEDNNTPDMGTVYRVDPDLSVTAAIPDTTLSNGLGWSPDDRQMYFIDTMKYRVDAWDFDVDSGEIHNRRVLCETPKDFLADGLTVDTDGGIWVALFGGARVQRYTPDGKEDVAVEMPVSEPTSCTFGGPDQDILFITTAAFPFGDWGHEDDAGSVYAARPGQTGLINNSFGG